MNVFSIFFLASLPHFSCALFRIYTLGTTANEGSTSYENARYAVERWNRESGRDSLNLTLISSKASHIEDKMCDLMGRGAAGIIIPYTASKMDVHLVSSMCQQFKIPCMGFQPPKDDQEYPMVTWIAPTRSSYALSASQFIRSLRWTSFLLTYEDETEVEELATLLAVDAPSGEPRPIIRSRKLPSQDSEMEPFLKYIRNTVKESNLVLHSANISTLFNLLQLATSLNMTQSPFSYFFMNTDLSLLEDFLNNVYGSVQCNVTGLQLVQSEPRMKTELALTVEAVFAIARGIWDLISSGVSVPHPTSISCGADNEWSDGLRVNDAIRKSEQLSHLTGDVRFDGKGRRYEPLLHGIARIDKRFIQIGNWSEMRGWIFDAAFTNRWKYSVDPGANDLKGFNLRVVVYIEEPFVMKNEKGEYEGFCIDLLQEMALALDFNYTIVEVLDGTYGIEDETGRWNGIIGVLQRHEADLSVSAVTITYSRGEVIDFTLPFMHLGISILLAKPSDDASKPSLFMFLEPLSLSVWLCLLAAYLSVSFSMFLLARFSPYEWYEVDKLDSRDLSMQGHKNQFTALNSLWFAVGSLMQQGSDVIPRAAATRIVAVVWWMFTQILISSYTAQLAAFLTVERMATPIESSSDLASQQKIKYGVLKSGSTMDFFRESKIPIYERMWSIMESSSPSVFVNSSREGIARVKAGNYAYMMESTMLEYYMERDCQLQSIGGLLDSKGYGIALPKGSPLRDIMSRTVLQLQERTILEALKNKWWKDRRGDTGTCSNQLETSPISSLQSVYGIFYVLATGLVVALLLAIGEYCIETRREDSFRLEFTFPAKVSELWNRLRGKKNDHHQRSKLLQVHLDSMAQPTMRDGGGQGQLRSGDSDGVEQLIRNEQFKRISRLMPFADESLLHHRLKPHSQVSSSHNTSSVEMIS